VIGNKKPWAKAHRLMGRVGLGGARARVGSLSAVRCRNRSLLVRTWRKQRVQIHIGIEVELPGRWTSGWEWGRSRTQPGRGWAG